MSNSFTYTVMIVDDDAAQREVLVSSLSGMNFRFIEAVSPESALRLLLDEQVDLLLSDVRMGKMSGLDLLKIVHKKYPTLPVLLVTAFADVKGAVDAMKHGAVNYLEKPVDINELQQMVTNILGVDENVTDTDKLPILPNWIIADGTTMKDLLHEVAKVSPFDARVLISGESGTGKEVIAELIHHWSPRKDKPLVKVNCAAIPENLLESEFFGHEKGAFTGAVKQRIGRFEEAQSGTLFLDEISEISLPLQAKLLRVIQEGTFTRVGSNKEHHSKARVITATNRNLEEEVAIGRFREDLFYRLNVIELSLPPLRDRKGDILPLASSFATRLTGSTPRFSATVTTSLMLYDWPGNVRELHNAIERAALMAGGGVILMEHLPKRINRFSVKNEETVKQKTSGGRIEQMERAVILQTLKENKFNRTETAKVLGITRRTLTHKLNRLSEDGYKVKSLKSSVSNSSSPIGER